MILQYDDTITLSHHNIIAPKYHSTTNFITLQYRNVTVP